MAKAGEHKIVPCERCGVLYRQSRSDQRYCSRVCVGKAWRAANAKPPCACAHCGASFQRRQSIQKYCTPECTRKAGDARKRAARVGGPGKQWSAGKEYVPRRLCEACGARFYAPPALVKRGGGRFCSRDCHVRWQSMHPETFPQTSGRRGIGGKRADLDNRYFRSAWEANWARYLNWLLSVGEIRSWEYEVDTFEFTKIKRGTRFYTPDFKVTNKDGSLEYHEIKGYMDDRSATKMKRMAKYYPNVRVLLIDGDAYKAIARQFRNLPNWEGSARHG